MSKVTAKPTTARRGRIGAQVSLGSVSAALQSAPVDDGQPAKLATVPLQQIELDDSQVRQLGFSPGDIARYRSDESSVPEDKRAQFDKLKGLADTIDVDGLFHPIRLVQLAPGQYRVLIGERRFLAHLLLQKAHIRAFVVSENHSTWSKKTTQLIENIHQEALNLPELVSALIDIADDHRLDQGRYPDVKFVQRRLGQARSTAYRYLSIMTADRDTVKLVQRAISQGQVTNLKRVAELCGHTPAQVKAALKPKKRARRISLGGTSHPAVLTTITRHLDAAIDAKEISSLSSEDWSNPDRVAKHLKALITHLEAQCG